MSTGGWISALESGWRHRDPNAIAARGGAVRVTNSECPAFPFSDRPGIAMDPDYLKGMGRGSASGCQAAASIAFLPNRSAPLPCSIDSMKKFESRMGGLLTDRSDDGEGDQRAQ